MQISEEKLPKKKGKKVKFRAMQGEKSLPWGEKSTGEKVTQPKVDTFTADDANCSGTPSGGCVVGRCWEACSSWIPVPLFGLFSWLAG